MSSGLARSSTRSRRWAWLVAAVPLAFASTVSADLRAAGMADHTVVALGLLLGVACGALWQRLDRCDLADRFAGPALLAPLAGLLLLLPGWTVESAAAENLAGVALIIGTVSGLVLAEQWMRQRVRP